MAHQCNAEVLSGVPKCEKTILWLTVKILVLNELRLGVSYRAVGYEINIKESKIDVKLDIFKQGYISIS